MSGIDPPTESVESSVTSLTRELRSVINSDEETSPANSPSTVRFSPIYISVEEAQSTAISADIPNMFTRAMDSCV